MSSRLTEPTLLGVHPVRNRVWLAPLTNLQSHADGRLSEAERRWLLRRAEGGFGVVETCASYVSADGRGWAGAAGIATEAHGHAWAGVGAALARRGALGIVQLFHGGVRSPRALTGEQPWSASAFPEDSAGFEVPRAATEADITGLIANFAAAAARAVAAGFAGVELHAAHGYLLSQFLSATQNQRSDAWGGDATRRAALLRAVFAAVRAAVPAGTLVGVRLSPEDSGMARGLDLDDSLGTAAALARDGVDFLHLSLWDATRHTRKRPSEHPIPLFRERVGAVPLVVAGGIWSRADAEAVLARGADFVALGRAGIAHPDWPQRAVAADFAPARPPFAPESLRRVDVSPRFVSYLRRFPGFVHGP